MLNSDKLQIHQTTEKWYTTITLAILNETLRGSLPINVGAKLLVHCVCFL